MDTGTQGTITKGSLLVGRWNSLDLIMQGAGAATYHMGAIDNAVIEISRTIYRHISNHNIRRVDMVMPIGASMVFKCMFYEHHLANYNAMLNVSLSSSTQYLYPGGDEACDVFMKVHGRRERSCDHVVLDFYQHKALQVAPISFGGGDEAVGVQAEFEALDDTDGTYGGSSTSPYGYIWLPATPAANHTP